MISWLTCRVAWCKESIKVRRREHAKEETKKINEKSIDAKLKINQLVRSQKVTQWGPVPHYEPICFYICPNLVVHDPWEYWATQWQTTFKNTWKAHFGHARAMKQKPAEFTFQQDWVVYFPKVCCQQIFALTSIFVPRLSLLFKLIYS